MADRAVTVIPARKTFARASDTNVLRVAAYARVSTDSDEQMGSVAAQKDYTACGLCFNIKKMFSVIFSLCQLRTNPPVLRVKPKHRGLSCAQRLTPAFLHSFSSDHATMKTELTDPGGTLIACQGAVIISGMINGIILPLMADYAVVSHSLFHLIFCH